MKKLICALLALLLVLSLAACNKTENPVEDEDKEEQTTPDTENNTEVDPETDGDAENTVVGFDYENEDLTKYIVLGNYEGLTATKGDDTATQEDVDDYIQQILESYSEYEHVTDRVVAEGDTVVADYRGVRDGENFQGGTAVDQTIVAADGQGYIPGFGPAFVGKMPGEEFSFNVTFPDPYPNDPDMSGVEVTFVCTVKYIMGTEIVPAQLNDEFVQKLNFTDVDDFMNTVNKIVQLQKVYQVNGDVNNQLWAQIVEGSQVLQYPEGQVDAVYQEYRQEYEYYASYYGTDYDTFLATYVGIDDAGLHEMSESYVKEDLVFYQLTKVLDSKISDAEYQGKVESFAAMYDVSPDEIIQYYGEEGMKQIAQYDKNMSIVAGLGTVTSAE